MSQTQEATLSPQGMAFLQQLLDAVQTEERDPVIGIFAHALRDKVSAWAPVIRKLDDAGFEVEIFGTYGDIALLREIADQLTGADVNMQLVVNWTDPSALEQFEYVTVWIKEV